MRKSYRIIAFVTACTLGVGMISGCTKKESENTEKVKIEKMEPEESAAVSFDIIGGKDVMPIAGFYGPFNPKASYDGNAVPNYLTEDVYQALSEAGVNLIAQAYISGDDNKLKALDLGEKYGIGLLVSDDILSNPSMADQMSDVELAERLVKWSGHPAYCGIHVTDEPGSEVFYSQGGNGGMMEDYADLCKRLTEKLGTFNSTNLIRCYSSTVKSAYELYLQQFFETCSPTVLSYDYYPFCGDTRGTEDLYFWNLAIVREYAQKYNVPFWNYIQTGYWDASSKEEYEKYCPTEEQFAWSINTSLAFGVQGFVYFPLIQPDESMFSKTDGNWNFETSGLLGIVQNKTRYYYYAQNISKQVAAIDEVLMNSVNKGILAVGTAKKDCGDARDAVIKGNSWRELASVDGDTMAGCFNYQGKTALYVVNYDTEYAQKINLTFHDSYKMQMIQNGEKKLIKAENLTLDMKAGEGVLLVIE